MLAGRPRTRMRFPACASHPWPGLSVDIRSRRVLPRDPARQGASFSHAPLLLKCEKSLSRRPGPATTQIKLESDPHGAPVDDCSSNVSPALRISHVRVDTTITLNAVRLNRRNGIFGGFSVGDEEILWKLVELLSHCVHCDGGNADKKCHTAKNANSIPADRSI